ncbi:MAG: response regulator [Candidatus Rokuibacteriota bacterium]
MSGKIMVIDDHPYMRDILANFLGAGGHQFALCSDGASALERLGREPFDLVVTDLRLPDLPGFTVVRRVKELRPSTPVALITGAGDLVPSQELGRYGIDYLLPKPFTRQQFMTVVASALGQPV